MKCTDVEYSEGQIVLGAPDRVNIPCLMHECWRAARAGGIIRTMNLYSGHSDRTRSLNGRRINPSF